MKKSSGRWSAFRGRLLVLVGVIAILVAVFLPNQIPDPLFPLVVLFGVGFIVLAIPWRIWQKLPGLFSRDDTWL